MANYELDGVAPVVSETTWVADSAAPADKLGGLPINSGRDRILAGATQSPA